MTELLYVNGRLMQRQPSQQQQGKGDSSPAQPTAVAALPPPTIVNTQKQQDDVQNDLSARKGALANLKNGPDGTAPPTVATATPSPGTAALLG